MSVWSILGALALGLFGVIVNVVVWDLTEQRFPNFASWWKSTGGGLVRVSLLTVAMVGNAGFCLLMASSETDTGLRQILWFIAALGLVTAATQIYAFRRDLRRTRV